MTNVANKHGLRAAAARRTTKHAQRNVTTGERTAVRVAAEVASDMPSRQDPQEETGTERQLSYGTMTVDELKARARELKVSPLPRTKGPLVAAILEAEGAQQPAEQEMPAPDVEFVDGQSDPETMPPAVGNDGQGRISNSDECAPEPAAGLNPKGLVKANRFFDSIAKAGWAELPAITGDDATVTLAVRRGHEAITISWTYGVFQYDTAAHMIGDRVIKIRNVSEAIKLGLRSSEAAEADLRRVSAYRSGKEARVASKTEIKPELDFDPIGMTEQELFARLGGRKVEWLNSTSGQVETDVVSSRPRWFRIDTLPARGACLQFCSPDGFRALRLANLLRVL